MKDFFVTNSWIISFLPLWSALLIMFFKGLNIYENKEITSLLTLGASFLGFFWSLGLLGCCLQIANFNYEIMVPFLNVGLLSLSFGFLIDNLSVLMLLIVTSVSFAVQLYSRTYMANDKEFHRFFVYLNLFNFSMLSLVMSPNLLQMYVFWELVGVCSYLLIGFWFKRPSAAKAATKAFLINRIGDFAFLASICALGAFSFWFWKFSNVPFLDFSALNGAALSVLGTTTPLVFFLISLGFVLAACTKSAQIPLHVWLVDAMEGPTPVSALIHAATMVAAGVLLIARVYPFLNYSPVAMSIIAWIGVLTAFIMAVIAIFQNDIKKMLAFSTSSQLGFMMVALGVGGYSAALFHLTTHAYFKALLFLCAGAVIHSVNLQDMRYMGELRKSIPFVAGCYLIGVCAISGILLSGFWSKEAIFYILADTSNFGLLALALLSSLLTVIYMLRSYFMIFEGKYNGTLKTFHIPPWGIKFPILLLVMPSVFLGWLVNEPFKTFIKTPLALPKLGNYEILFALSLIIIVIGVLLAFVLYYNGIKEKIKISFIRKFRKFAQQGLYFNKFYEFLIEKLFLKITRYAYLFDKYLVDGVVNFWGLCVQVKSKFLLFWQNGNILSYSTVGVAGLCLLMVVFLLGFSVYMLEVWL